MARKHLPVNRHEQLKSRDWDKAFIRYFDSLPNNKKYANPRTYAPTPYREKGGSIMYSGHFEACHMQNLGALCLMRRRPEEAQAWFEAGFRGCLLEAQTMIARSDGWPDYSKPHPYGNSLVFTLETLFKLASLAFRETPPALLADPFRSTASWFLSGSAEEDERPTWLDPPNPARALTRFNGIFHGLLHRSFLAAWTLGDAPALAEVERRAERTFEWFRGLGWDRSRMEARGSFAPKDEAVMRAVRDRSPQGFVDALAKETETLTFSWEPLEWFLMVSDADYVALYVQAWRDFGPLPLIEINRIPPRFDVSDYWAMSSGAGTPPIA